jgi:hypothetical protein
MRTASKCLSRTIAIANVVKNAIAIAALFALHGCAAGPHLGGAQHVTITERGTDRNEPSAYMCQGFDLSQAEATRFLQRALIVTRYELHDRYNFLPCFVRGTAEFDGKPASWEIRAGGTGTITFWSEFTFLVVDETQRDHDE